MKRGSRFQNLSSIKSLAIVGATGLVGKEMIDIIDEHKIAIADIRLLASKGSAGTTLEVLGKSLVVEELTAASFQDVEVAFLSVPNAITKKFSPIAMESGCLVVDDSSVFRMIPEVPLVIPEVNGEVLKDFDGSLMAIPNCSTTPVALCLKPLHDRYGVKRVVVSTYQSVSGAGRRAFEELSEQTSRLMNGMSIEPEVFPHPIAFNCLPQIGGVAESGNTDEEEKVIRELRKILDLPELRVSATAVRVPTFSGHGVSVNVEFHEDFDSVETIREMLDRSPGLHVLDRPSSAIYPTNREATGSDETFVGRIRRDESVTSGINFWTITDNLRKGAALNALECLDTLYGYRKLN